MIIPAISYPSFGQILINYLSTKDKHGQFHQRIQSFTPVYVDINLSISSQLSYPLNHQHIDVRYIISIAFYMLVIPGFHAPKPPKTLQAGREPGVMWGSLYYFV